MMMMASALITPIMMQAANKILTAIDTKIIDNITHMIDDGKHIETISIDEKIVENGVEKTIEKTVEIISENKGETLVESNVKKIIIFRNIKTLINYLISYKNKLNTKPSSNNTKNSQLLDNYAYILDVSTKFDKSNKDNKDNNNLIDLNIELREYLLLNKINLPIFKKIDKLEVIDNSHFIKLFGETPHPLPEIISNPTIGVVDVIEKIVICLVDNIIKEMEKLMDTNIKNVFSDTYVQEKILKTIKMDCNEFKNTSNSGGIGPPGIVDDKSFFRGGTEGAEVTEGSGGNKQISKTESAPPKDIPIENSKQIIDLSKTSIDIPQANLIELITSLKKFLDKQTKNPSAFDILSGETEHITKMKELSSKIKLSETTKNTITGKITTKLKNSIIKYMHLLFVKKSINNTILTTVTNTYIHINSSDTNNQSSINFMASSAKNIAERTQNMASLSIGNMPSGLNMIPGFNMIMPLLNCFTDSIINIIIENLEVHIIKTIISEEVRYEAYKLIAGIYPAESKKFFGLWGGNKKSNKKYRLPNKSIIRQTSISLNKESKKIYRKHRKTVKHKHKQRYIAY